MYRTFPVHITAGYVEVMVFLAPGVCLLSVRSVLCLRGVERQLE